MSSRIQDAWMPWLAYACAAVGLVGSVFFILMFVTEVPFNGPFTFGATYEVLAAVGGVLAALLVLRLRRQTARSSAFPPLVVVALVIGALAALLVSFHIFDAVFLILVQGAVIVVQGVWMIWINRRLGREGTLSQWTSRLGQLIGWGLVIGLPLMAIGLALAVLTIPQLLFLGFGVFLAGGGWLIWPLWWVLVGIQLSRPVPVPASSPVSGGAGASTGYPGAAYQGTPRPANSIPANSYSPTESPAFWIGSEAQRRARAENGAAETRPPATQTPQPEAAAKHRGRRKA